VKGLNEEILVPRPLLKELYEHFGRIEEILATLEELSDKKGLKRIEKSLEEYKKKEFDTVTDPEKIREALLKD
jgi:hypothetical protein